MQTKPAITIQFDPATQNVAVQVDPEQVKNWDYALALLKMGELAADGMRRMAQMQAIQRQVESQAQDQMLARKILRN